MSLSRRNERFSRLASEVAVHSHLRSPHIAVVLLGTVFLAICQSGCVRRRMTVRTSPPGATISVDNQVIGTSPAATSFVYYGTREVRVEKDGFRTETIRRRLNPPWYEFPGLDFISETLWPGELRDERIIDVQLVPKMLEPTPNVLERADALRSQSQAGIVTAPR
ncbi:PEGA domain protein [Planctomycetes bacterium CA13]|uniref:PEGA domain protein n=1 Tax=Novipirellula herctigrandis TaxID=2527986 RepID=A0A5C5Z952_9BACT|nr:PEGA domain protein [Planctomycetes bacterium CA13]